MSNPTALRRRRDLAYGCFFLPGTTALLGSLGSLFPAALVEPAYFGFFVLIPLTLASAIALIAGTILTLTVGRNDPILIALLAATGIIIAFVIAAFSDSMPVRIEGPVVDVSIAAYGLAALCISIHWFAVRRGRSG
jgi:hypothetical protein